MCSAPFEVDGARSTEQCERACEFLRLLTQRPTSAQPSLSVLCRSTKKDQVKDLGRFAVRRVHSPRAGFVPEGWSGSAADLVGDVGGTPRSPAFTPPPGGTQLVRSPGMRGGPRPEAADGQSLTPLGVPSGLGSPMPVTIALVGLRSGAVRRRTGLPRARLPRRGGWSCGFGWSGRLRFPQRLRTAHRLNRSAPVSHSWCRCAGSGRSGPDQRRGVMVADAASPPRRRKAGRATARRPRRIWSHR